MDRLFTDEEVVELRDLAKEIARKRKEKEITDKIIITEKEFSRRLELGKSTNDFVPLTKIMKKFGNRWIAK